MTTKIGLISDTHSTLAPLQEAMSIFKQQQVDMIICAGDVAGYGADELSQSIDLLQQHKCKIVAGNHDVISENQDYGNQTQKIEDFFKHLPLSLDLIIENKKVYVVHAQPPDIQHGGIKLLNPEGEIDEKNKHYWQQQLKDFPYDVLIVGHTHQIYSEQFTDLQIINPGSTQFNHSCMILSLPEMKVEIFSLSNMTPVLTWNWGIYYREQNA